MIPSGTRRLRDYSERGLSILASVVAKKPLQVSLSERVKEPATFVVQSKSIHLDPRRAGLFDLLLMAELARVHEGGHSSWVAAEVPYARARLLEQFDGAARLAGVFRHHGHPEIRWDRLELSSLADGAGVGGVSTSGVQIDGAEDDFDAIFRSLAAGGQKTREVPEMPGVPILDLPLTFDSLVADDETWAWAADARETVEEAVQSTIRCIQRRAEGLIELSPTRRPRGAGRHLDPRRLARMRVARAIGQPFSPFRGKKIEIQGSFRPERRLEVLCLDAATIRSESTIRANARLSVMLIESMRRLGIDSAVIVFDDRARDGQGYLHVSGLLKDVDEEVGGRVWARLHHLEHLGSSPDTASCLSLQLRTVSHYLERLIRPRHNQVNVLMIADGARGLERDDWDSLEEISQHATREIQALGGRFDASIDLGGLLRRRVRSHLPRSVRGHFHAF